MAMPTIQNSTAVADLSWDPFDPRRLAVGMCAIPRGVRQASPLAHQITLLTTAHPFWCRSG